MYIYVTLCYAMLCYVFQTLCVEILINVVTSQSKHKAREIQVNEKKKMFILSEFEHISPQKIV